MAFVEPLPRARLEDQVGSSGPMRRVASQFVASGRKFDDMMRDGKVGGGMRDPHEDEKAPLLPSMPDAPGGDNLVLGIGYGPGRGDRRRSSVADVGGGGGAFATLRPSAVGSARDRGFSADESTEDVVSMEEGRLVDSLTRVPEDVARPAKVPLTRLPPPRLPHYQRSPNQGGPVDVAISILIKELSNVDLNTGTFHCSMGIKVTWNDRRLRGCRQVPDDLWCPNVMMPNAVDLDEGTLYNGAAGVQITNVDTGQLQFHRNVQASFSCHFGLRKFPFDEHVLGIRFNGSKLRDGRPACASDQVLHAGISSAVIDGPTKNAPFVLWGSTLADLIPEYELIGNAHSAFIKNNCSFISWGVVVRRHWSYYMLKIVSLLWLTTILSAFTWTFPATAVMGKIESIVGCFTAVIAFLFVINDKLPKTPFLHKMDKLIIFSLFFIFFVGAEAIAEYLIIGTCFNVTAVDSFVGVRTYPCYGDTTNTVLKPFKYASMLVMSTIFVVVQALLFLGPICRNGCGASSTRRPAFLHDSKTFVPVQNIVTIDLWAE